MARQRREPTNTCRITWPESTIGLRLGRAMGTEPGCHLRQQGIPERIFVGNKKATLLGWLSRLNPWLSSTEESGMD